MKKFKVTACYYTYCTAVVEAEDAEQAEAIAKKMDGSEFTPSNERGDWHINHAEEISELHSCPYAEAIHGDYETLCDCDEESTRQCAQDI